MNTPKQSKVRFKFYLALVVSSALIALDVLTDTPPQYVNVLPNLVCSV